MQTELKWLTTSFLRHFPPEVYAHPESNPLIVANGQSPMNTGLEPLQRPRMLMSITKPIPPPPTALRKDYPPTTQRVVFPPKENCYKWVILPLFLLVIRLISCYIACRS